MTDLLPIPTQCPNVLALKAFWRGNSHMSTCAPLAGKLAAIEAAKAGASPVEANYVGQGYELPTGWSWSTVAAHRALHDIAPHMVPVASVASGPAAWGTPIVAGAYLLHPGNVGGA